MSRCAMKNIFFIFILLSTSFNSFASKCTSPDVSEEYPLKVTHQEKFMMNMWEYTISVPSEIDSEKIINIYLFSVDEEGLVQDNLMVPIHYELVEGRANAKFTVNPRAENYKIQVWYGSVCGPRVWHVVKST